MLTDIQKKQIRLYSVAESNRKKSDRRRADAEEVACGNAKAVQERNRLVPCKRRLKSAAGGARKVRHLPGQRERFFGFGVKTWMFVAR